jgi:hypothetical protein
VGTTPKTASKAAVFCRLPTGREFLDIFGVGMAARPGNDSRKFAHGVRGSHLFKWGRGEVIAGLVLCCHGPEEPESLGVLGEEQK